MRILLVDDEADVLLALIAIMKTVPGHTVRVAANSQKAHEHAAALGGVDLLVTDVVMEPTDGFTLRAELEALYPEMQTIFVSGYDLSDYTDQIGGVPVLAKPVDADSLRGMVASFEERPAAMAAVPTPPPSPAVARVAVAQPTVAQAQAVPRAVPQVSAAPQPTAAPRAVAATPAPQPIAVPRPVVQAPMAIPVQPQAVPVAQPAAVPRAAVAQPSAVPVAVPQATVQLPPPIVSRQPVAQAPMPIPVQPQAVPVAQPTAVPRPAFAQPPALPVAPPQSTVRAVPQPVPGQAVGPTAVRPAQQPAAVSGPTHAGPAAVPGAGTDPLIGVQLGDYRVQQLLGRDDWGKIYSALQLSVNRRVGLRVLDPEMAEDEHNRMRFLADARAKAAVQHPIIVSVFEADERNGLVFYTHESLDGATMEERIKHGQFLDEKTALQVMKAAAEGLQYVWSRNLAHGPLDASGLRVGADNIARLANLAIADPDPSVTVETEIHTLGTIIQQLVPDKLLSNGLRTFLARMTGGANPVTSWAVVLQAVKALEPKVIPVEAAKIKAADAAAMRALEAASIAKRRALYISIGTLCALVGVLGVVIARVVISNARKLDAQVVIPAGDYIVGSPEEGHKASLGEYEIDKYEVTINEYAKFFEWCKANPSQEHDFDHPRGERRTSHLDPDVEVLIGKARARGARAFATAANPARNTPADPGVAVDLNSPMVAVTFWDAYAYAQWRGKMYEGGIPRDLPTEEEWEAAARGPKGFKYPWGDELKLKNFNSNEGYKPLVPGAPQDDGYNYWAAVDEFTRDVSTFGVVGMAGNVCEWVYRKEANREIPLLKGGSFASEPIPMWGRILKIPADDARYVWPAANKPQTKTPQNLGDTRLYVGDDVMASTRSLYIGFRTVKRK